MPPADVERAPSYDEVDDRPSSTVVTQKEEVTEQIFDQGESISESTESPNYSTIIRGHRFCDCAFKTCVC